MMILKYIGLVLSLILLIGCILWIARQCWLDSKDDFKKGYINMKDAFYAFLCRNKILHYTCGGEPFVVEYHRTPFWTYETPSLKLFLKEKVNSWHGQVWKVFPNGGRCGYESVHVFSWFPRRKMRRFLKLEAERISELCASKSDEDFKAMLKKKRAD